MTTEPADRSARIERLRMSLTPEHWFREWRGPRDFFLAADRSMGLFEPDEILGMTGVQYLFDAYVGGLFARIWNDHAPCSVKLAEDNFPDAHLRDGEGTRDLEITMADQRDRRMTAEYRALRERREMGEVVLLPIERERDREHAVEAVPRVCREKVVRYLGPNPSGRRVPVHLLIYANFSTLYGPVLSDEEMIRLTEPWRDNFQSIWLLCGARIFRPWPVPLAMSAQSDPIG